MGQQMLPIFKYQDSKCTAQLVEVLHAGSKLTVTDSLIEQIGQIQDLMHRKGHQIEQKENKGQILPAVTEVMFDMVALVF